MQAAAARQDKAAFANRAKQTQPEAPADFAGQRAATATRRMVKVHIVDYVVNEALKVAVDENADTPLSLASRRTVVHTRRLANAQYATYEHTLRVGNHVRLLAELEAEAEEPAASFGRKGGEQTKEAPPLGVGVIKAFVEVRALWRLQATHTLLFGGESKVSGGLGHLRVCVCDLARAPRTALLHFLPSCLSLSLVFTRVFLFYC